MDEERPIQVSFQIPPSALESLSRLAEQLRLLTEAANAPLPPGGRSAEAGHTEHAESGSFDPERFMALRESAGAPPEAVGSADTEIGDARTASVLLSPVEDAGTVSVNTWKEPQSAESAGDLLDLHSRDEPPPDVPGDANWAPSEKRDLPVPSSETDTDVPDAPEAWRAVEQQVPDVESARAGAELQKLVPVPVQGEVSEVVETPLGAGVVVQTQSEMPQSRWSGITEELVIPGPAPLTAEAVSLAFERDGRRYDNGFPLY